jgi:hypothetical protein
MKKERPMLFGTPMVQSVLADIKSQTRRKINIQPSEGQLYGKARDLQGNAHWVLGVPATIVVDVINCPYGTVGDLLWVRETFTEWPTGEFQYKASTALGEELGKWKPSIHMPKKAARIWLEITDVRVERLHDISEQDAITEGIEKYGPFGEYKGSEHPAGGMMRYRAYDTAKRAYQDLWQSIYGEVDWKENPYVWVIEFKRIERQMSNKTLKELDYELQLAVDRIFKQIERRADMYIFNKLGGPDYLTPEERMRHDSFGERYGGFEIAVPPDYIFIDTVFV